mgnify:CR=1 FL=1
MKNDPRFSQEVKIAKESASTWSTRNPHARDNVNVAQGPRSGNRGTPAKRRDFIDAKASREPLATMIQDAYTARAHEYKEFEYTNGGSIHDNTREEFKKRSRK